MDDWAWEQLVSWVTGRLEVAVGSLVCVVNGPTRGRLWSAAAARSPARRRSCVERPAGHPRHGPRCCADNGV
jgi:hypothetical protein